MNGSLLYAHVVPSKAISRCHFEEYVKECSNTRAARAARLRLPLLTNDILVL